MYDKMERKKTDSIRSLCYFKLTTGFKIGVLLMVLLAQSEAKIDILQAILPDIYLPVNCTILHLNGFYQGILISQRPDLPTYQPNVYCKIVITVRGKCSVIFTVDKFDLDPPDSNGYCTDALQIFNRQGKILTPLTERLCGTKEAFKVTSNNGEVIIVFNTDSVTQQHSGFRIKYERMMMAQSSSDNPNNPMQLNARRFPYFIPRGSK